jgi:hypothetical protein
LFLRYIVDLSATFAREGLLNCADEFFRRQRVKIFMMSSLSVLKMEKNFQRCQVS